MPLPDKQKYTADEFFKMFPESNSERYELYQGEVVAMASPSIQHQNIVLGLGSEIRAYIKKNKGKCQVFVAPVDVKLTDDTVVIPDVFVVCDPSKIDEKRCNGAPDWVIEVTSSNYRTDYVDKLELYKEAGVREYWIINPEKNSVTVLLFEKNPANFMLYRFSDIIPVNIYKNAPIQLEICIENLF